MQPIRTMLYDPPEIEYLDGTAHPKVSPKRKHARLQAALSRILEDCAGDRGEVGTEWRFHVSEPKQTEFVPDVAFVSYGRLKQLAEPDWEEPPFAPDIVVEVRSPSDHERFIMQKIERYLRHGSLLVLDVDPETRRIVAHSLQGTKAYGPGDEFRNDAAPWLRFDVGKLFAVIDIPKDLWASPIPPS